MIIKNLKIYKILLISLIIFASISAVFAEQTDYTVVDYSKIHDPHDYLYNIYLKDPSEAIYNAEQEREIYDNYGSSASMEYLNRGDANSYNGGSDFDRNY